MHELSLLENVREIIEQEADSQQFVKVRQITLAIGALSCIETSAIRFAFDVVMADSLAADAELLIETVPARGRCRHCGKEMPMQALHQCCVFCDQYGVDIFQGNGLQIKELLVI